MTKHNHTYILLSTLVESEEMAEILTAFLADYPFESFAVNPSGESFRLDAHIRREEWAECRTEVIAIAQEYGTIAAEQEIKDENWNEQWERESFQPVVIDNLMVIRSAYHTPPADCDVLDVVISPSMSFGSGYHQTTRMICRMIYNLKPQGDILDMGCGTGVLSIVALKCGANHADAVDIDPWSAESAERAVKLNDLSGRMRVITGTVDDIAENRYDAIFANINRNIILASMAQYAACLKSGGRLLVSGFLEEDIDIILTSAAQYGITPTATIKDEGWVAISLIKA